MNKMRNSIILLVLFFLNVPLACSQTVQSISFQNLDSDSKSELAIITTVFNGRTYEISVYDGDGDMIESQDSKLCCDFDSDTWIFDSGADGKSELIIDFGEYNNSNSALIYDDIGGEVTYSVSNGKATVSGGLPRIIIEPRSGDWFIGDKPDYNLDLFVDSNWSMFGADAVFAMKDGGNDGDIDVSINYYDTDSDGDPDIEFNDKNLVGDFDAVIVDATDIQGIRNYLFFPLLESVIKVDWEKSRITRVDHLIPSRLTEGNYFIYFNKRFEANETVHGWESPFAFYDLANNNDKSPELILRVLDDPRMETEEEKKAGKQFYENIRYSWDQNEYGWYRIQLTGKNEYDSFIEYPFGKVRILEYEDAPNWVFDQEWYGQIFAVAESGKAAAGEGIYESWKYPYDLIHNHFENSSIKMPEYIPNRVGDREEYTFDYFGKPQLYFSPIDSRLHLKNARKGIWIKETDKEIKSEWYDISNGVVRITEKIEYQNTNSDGYIDKWTYYVDDIEKDHLIHDDDYLIRSDGERTRLLKTQIKQSLFELTPPRNNEEWVILGDKLKENKKDINGENFDDMFEQFSGELITINNGFLSDFENLDSGFQFTLKCTIECKIESFKEIDYQGPLTNERYLFVYDGAEFSILKWVAADLLINTENIIFSNINPTEQSYVEISAKIRNIGSKEVGPIIVQFFDGDPLQNGTLIGNRTISKIPSRGDITTSLRWVPTVGEKDVYILLDPQDLISEDQENNNIAFKPIFVSPIKPLSTKERLSIGTGNKTIVFSAIIFISMLVLGAFVSKLIFKEM
jgi:hypothetical protein